MCSSDLETRPGLPHLRLLLAPEGPVGRALEQATGLVLTPAEHDLQFDDPAVASPLVKWAMTVGSLFNWVFVGWVVLEMQAGNPLFNPLFLAVMVIISLVNTRRALRYWH